MPRYRHIGFKITGRTNRPVIFYKRCGGTKNKRKALLYFIYNRAFCAEAFFFFYAWDPWILPFGGIGEERLQLHELGYDVPDHVLGLFAWIFAGHLLYLTGERCAGLRRI